MTTTTLKTISSEFLIMCSKGSVTEAFVNYVGASFIHHNAYYPSDPASLMKGMVVNAQQFPLMTFEILRLMEDGDLVAVHSKARMTPTAKDYAIAHILRFENDRIVEMWDFGQEVPDGMVNEVGMF